MMSDYWIGVLTPFALVAAGVALWLLYSLATWAWARLHIAFLARVDLAQNPLRVYGRDDRRQYSVAAQKLVDSFIESPRLYVFSGLGWRFVLVRDYREHESKNPEVRTQAERRAAARSLRDVGREIEDGEANGEAQR